MNSLLFDDKLEKLQAELFILPLIIAHKDKIKRSFQEYTANLTYDLNAYKNVFDLLDSKYAAEPREIKRSVQQAIIETEGRKFMKFLDEKLEELEKIIINFSKKDHERHGYYLRKQLWGEMFTLDGDIHHRIGKRNFYEHAFEIGGAGGHLPNFIGVMRIPTINPGGCVISNDVAHRFHCMVDRHRNHADPT